jgi:hypothetical protein
VVSKKRPISRELSIQKPEKSISTAHVLEGWLMDLAERNSEPRLAALSIRPRSQKEWNV